MFSEQKGRDRRSIQLPDYNYSQPGWYFVTICTHERKMMFGSVVDGEMRLNASGEQVQKTWYTLPNRFPSVQLDEFVVMPNHVHGIIILTDTQASPSSSQQYLDMASVPEKKDSCAVPEPRLGEVIRTFKGAATYLIRSTINSAFAWQSRYYDHIIQNQADLDRIRTYIANNPAHWEQDKFHQHV